MCHLFSIVVAGLLIPVLSTIGAAADSVARGAADVAPANEATWSQESRGLRGRLLMRRSRVSNGTGIVTVYLELNNVSDIGSPMLVAGVDQSMTFVVTDADGREAPRPGITSRSGPVSGTPDLVLPFDSTTRFRIAPLTAGIPADQAAHLDLGSNFTWELPRDGKAYYLQAVLEMAEARGDRRRWHGRLELPRARIPTEPEPIDPATVAGRIEELGTKMLGKNYRKSESATRELSLIDDPWVIPWYVKAMKTDSYSLKFEALDQLSRFEGDEALDGLKIGMTTQGGDIGNTTTPELAASSASGIRHSSAIALARSPHPAAKALLFSMEKDPASSVRLTVIQTAARMDTPESLAVLKRGTQDADEIVRKEAVRLLEMRSKDARK